MKNVTSLIHLRSHCVLALLALTLPAQGGTVITAGSVVDTPAEFSGHWTATEFSSPAINVGQGVFLRSDNFHVGGERARWTISEPTSPGVAMDIQWLEGGFARGVWEFTEDPNQLRVQASITGRPVTRPFSRSDRGVTAEYTWTANPFGAPNAYEGTFSLTRVVVPEPHEYGILAGLGLLGFVAYRRFRG